MHITLINIILIVEIGLFYFIVFLPFSQLFQQFSFVDNFFVLKSIQESKWYLFTIYMATSETYQTIC